jgi:hypothetical protein
MTNGLSEKPRALESILYGGLAVGILDACDALFFFGYIRGVRPANIFQYVASGILGPSSFQGGARTTALRVLLHFVVAFPLATIYYLASTMLPVLIRHAYVLGPLYGIAAHSVMTFVVDPVSATPPRVRYPLAVMLN